MKSTHTIVLSCSVQRILLEYPITNNRLIYYMFITTYIVNPIESIIL
jgi:hypothetical protein